MERRKYVIYVVVLAAVVILNLPVPASLRMRAVAHDAAAPFQNVMSYLLYRVRETGQVLSGRNSFVEENKRLLEEIAGLKLQLRELQDEEKQNADLRRMLELKKTTKRKLVAAEVVARGDSLGWWQSVTINKGSDDGLLPNMAVISLSGLVGKTMDGVGRNSAQVLLLTDGMVKVACRLPRTGTCGIMHGMGASAGGVVNLEVLAAVEPYQLEYLDKDSDIAEGDEVVTSGLGGIFPDSLLIGYVKSWTLDASGLFKRAEVVPACDFSSLQTVFVVTK